MTYFGKYVNQMVKHILWLIVPLLALPLFTACSQQKSLPQLSLKEPLSSGVKLYTDKEPLRVVLAPLPPLETHVFYDGMLNYIEQKIGRPIEDIHRKSYSEANDLLRAGLADMAFVGTYAYVTGKAEFGLELLAAPLSSISYRANIIVNKDSSIESFSQLRGKTFALGDPLSTTGTLYPLSLVKSLGFTPNDFFSNYFYTYSSANVIQAVADNLADAGSADSMMLEYLHKNNPSLVEKVKVIQTSQPVGIPPVVVRPNLDPVLKKEIQTVLFTMDRSAEGKKILDQQNIQRFISINDNLYNRVRDLAKVVGSP